MKKPNQTEDSNVRINVNLENVPINKVIARVEAEALNLAMQAVKFNQSKAAKLLEMSRGTLRTKLRQYYPGVFLD